MYAIDGDESIVGLALACNDGFVLLIVDACLVDGLGEVCGGNARESGYDDSDQVGIEKSEHILPVFGL